MISNSAWASIACMVIICTLFVCLTIVAIKLGPKVIEKWK